MTDQSSGENPYIPGLAQPIIFEGFGGIDTSSSRPGIADDVCAWMDGFMPLGKNNARTLPGVGTAIYDVNIDDNGQRVIWFDFGNTGPTPRCIILLSDGGLVYVNTDTGISADFAPAGTIQNPALGSIDLSQWGSQYLILVADQTNGYFLWDGANLFQAGTLGPDITTANSGLDYTSQPAIIAIGGAGSGATFTTELGTDGSIEQVFVTDPGTGYSATDGPLMLGFSGGGSPGSSAVISLTIAAGAVVSGTVLDGGAGYTDAATATVVGGGGAGAEITLTVVGGAVTAVVVGTGGDGYTTNPSAIVIDPGNPVAQASIDVMPYGVGGTAVETYQSRVFVTRGNKLLYTAPDSVVDFSGANGGGFFVSRDSFLCVAYTKPIQTNGFLYLLADSSINYISNVQTAGVPLVTTFSNQNADPEIGTPWATAIDVFSRNIVFGNAFGVHVSYGGSVSKVSEPLDGVYNSVDGFAGFYPSSAKAIIFGKKVWMMLLPVIDAVSGQQVNKLFMWNGKVWWSSQQDVNLLYVQHQEINSIITAYGTDGRKIYPLFQKPSTGFTKTIQSKLWDKPGGYWVNKATTRLWGMFYYYSLAGGTLDVSIDNESGGSDYTLAAGAQPMTWVNAVGAPMTWVNAVGAPMTWTTAGVGIVVLPPTAVAQNGVLTGLTVTTQAADMAIISMMMEDEIIGYRG